MSAMKPGSEPHAKAASQSFTTIGGRERKRCLDMRARVVLNEAGTKMFLSRLSNLHRFAGVEGEVHYGFRLKSIDMPWLRRLLLAGLIERAEFPVRDVGSVKTDLGDLSRLVTFSLLYNRFRSAVTARAVDSDVIRRWNRLHPHQAMDAQNAISTPELQSALASRAGAIEEIKREILIPVLKDLRLDEKRSSEERHRLEWFARDLLNYMDPLVFFVLMGSAAKLRQDIERDVSKEINACLDKADLADYLALMVLEIMSAAERSTLIELVGPTVPAVRLRAMLENPHERNLLMSRLPNGLASAMVWSLARRWSLGRWRYRLRLSLFDGTSSYEDSKRLFEERGRLAIGDRSLKEFYKSGSGPYGDDGLGWYYLSFLGDACQNMGVGFEASVRERTGRGTAAVNLVFVF